MNQMKRNPILVSYASKGILPYRGLGSGSLGSGIKRALEAWPEIDFANDRDGYLFTATVHRKAVKKSEIVTLKPDDPLKSSEKSSVKGSEIVSVKTKGSLKSSPKSPEKTEDRIVELICQDESVTTEQMGKAIGISKRAILKQINKLKKQGRLHRIGPTKGGRWEVLK